MDIASNDAYTTGYEAGKKQKLTEHVQAAVRKRVNLIHAQVIFFRAFAQGVQLAPQRHLTQPKKERLQKFLLQLEQILDQDGEVYRTVSTVE